MVLAMDLGEDFELGEGERVRRRKAGGREGGRNR